MKVTRVAYSKALNAGKYGQLVEQARRLGVVRSIGWQQYGSVNGTSVRDREVRDQWLRDGTPESFGVLANPWKETLRDAMGDITANREAAKVKARQAIRRHTTDEAERKRLYTLLKADRWASDPYLSRIMRKYWVRGKNRTHDQVVVRADQHTSCTLTEGGDVWLAVPGLERRQRVLVPLGTKVAPSGTLRLILRGNRVEVHYQIDAATLKSAQRPAGAASVGVDKGYTEVLVDADGIHHGPDLGPLLTVQSDKVKARGKARAKLRTVRDRAIERGDLAKADRIDRHNLGTVKRTRQDARWKQHVRMVTYRAVNAVVDKASVVVAEDLTKTFTGRRNLGRNMNRRLAAWTKGVTAQALHDVSERRGSALSLVNAAYTSQVDPRTGLLAVRKGEWLHLPGGVVMQADHAAAINVLSRLRDPDITLWTPHTRVKQILQGRTESSPDQTAGPGLQPPGAESEPPNQLCACVHN